MRTPRLFLGIFALALILPLLLLACGGSDEPADGPSSELATNEPDGRISSGQTTAAPTTEGAEPSPTPRATAEPTRQRVSLISTPQPTAVPSLAPTSPETDRDALVALYNATGGPNWFSNDNWLSDTPIGEWEGVTTDSNGRVTELFLRENQLTGEIPPELGNLASLEELHLCRNQLSGQIPPELGNLAILQELDLVQNQLSGEIPPELGSLANLTTLNLRGNELSGEIPPELGNLTNLTELYLSGSQLSGEIPPELGNLTNLTELYLNENQLSGEIPPELGSRANLAYLHLSENQLNGEIPPELGNLANLTRLVLVDNQLSGEIPPELGNLEPNTSDPRREPVERVRAKQFVGPVGYGIFRPGRTPILPVRPRLTRPIAEINSPRSAQGAEARVLCALRNVRRPPGGEPFRRKPEGCWTVSTATAAAGRSSLAGDPTSRHRLRSNPTDSPPDSPSSLGNGPETAHGC